MGSLQGNSPSPSRAPDEGVEKTKAQCAPWCLSKLRSGGLGGGGETIPMYSEQREGLKLQCQELSYSHIALCENGLGTSSSPTCFSSFLTQNRTSDQHQLLSKLPPLSGKTWAEPHPSCLIVFVPLCHHQSGWHSHVTALIFPTVLREAWQGQCYLLRTIKAYLVMYLMSEALCTESKSQC